MMLCRCTAGHEAGSAREQSFNIGRWCALLLACFAFSVSLFGTECTCAMKRAQSDLVAQPCEVQSMAKPVAESPRMEARDV